MRYYCTHFDINYSAHAKSLHSSLMENGGSFTLFMFCMCEESFTHLKSLFLPNVTLINYKQLEEFFPELLIAKNNRSKVEYFYTCSPATCYYVLSNFDDVDLITYLDADLYFFSSPEPIFQELGEKSIGIIEHKFGWLTKRNIIYGKYNVGWINFRKDKDGLKCLTDWMSDCLNWCYQKLEGEKYADQKYLDTWPTKYDNLHIIKNIGANLAVWNISNYKLKKIDDRIFVDHSLLIFYHFANFKQIAPNIFKTDLSRVFKSTSGVIKDDIYIPYIKRIIQYKSKDKIYAKNDAHISGVYSFVVNLSRVIREKLHPDLIEVK